MGKYGYPIQPFEVCLAGMALLSYPPPAVVVAMAKWREHPHPSFVEERIIVRIVLERRNHRGVRRRSC